MQIKKEISQISKIHSGCENFIKVYNSKHQKYSYLGNWVEKESHIFLKEITKTPIKKPNFKRGEVIKVDFGVNIGSELSNTHYAIVLNKDDSIKVDNITVLPLTSKKGYKRLHIKNVLEEFGEKYKEKETYALITQITTISKNKIFKDKIRYYCDSYTMDKIDAEIISFLTK